VECISVRVANNNYIKIIYSVDEIGSLLQSVEPVNGSACLRRLVCNNRLASLCIMPILRQTKLLKFSVNISGFKISCT